MPWDLRTYNEVVGMAGTEGTSTHSKYSAQSQSEDMVKKHQKKYTVV